MVRKADGMEQGVLHLDRSHLGPEIRRGEYIAYDIHAGRADVFAEARGRVGDAGHRQGGAGQRLFNGGGFHRPGRQTTHRN